MSHKSRIHHPIALQSRTLYQTRRIIRLNAKAHEVIKLERKFHHIQTLQAPQIDTLQLAHEWGIHVQRAQTITEQITLTRERKPEPQKAAPQKIKFCNPSTPKNTHLKGRTLLLIILIALGLWIDLTLLLKLF